MTFVTTGVAISLLTFKHLGIEVEEKVFQKIRGFYTHDKLRQQDNSFAYTLDGIIQGVFQQVNKASAGRTVAALWPMWLLGLGSSETWKKAKTFSLEHVNNVDLSQHGPSFHVLWAGLACFYNEDKALWKKYQDHFRNAISAAQKEDGSILIKPREKSVHPVDEVNGKGPIFTTPQYATILLLHKGHLLFDKLKPLSIIGDKK